MVNTTMNSKIILQQQKKKPWEEKKVRVIFVIERNTKMKEKINVIWVNKRGKYGTNIVEKGLYPMGVIIISLQVNKIMT